MKNAYFGYSYQKHVTSLLLAKMDVERELDVIEIEADVKNDFDDLKIQSRTDEFYFQIKDINDVSLSALDLKSDSIFIKGKEHILSKFTNVIFFRHVDIIPNSEVLGLPAYKLRDVYIISLDREAIDELISNLFNLNRQRELVINRFFSRCLDNRKLIIERKDLPSINVFDTKLIEKTIDIGRKHLIIENILILEGKPGIGKSHLVNCLVKEYPNNIIYRFWISSQDKEYSQRLKFSNFIFDFSKKLFDDQVQRMEGDVLEKLWELQCTVIIDGLDHVENYNRRELNKYFSFIEKVQTKCKTIVLTRPLQYKLRWKKHELVNWNERQTRKVLDELFHITEYNLSSKIYAITNGYPILVKYLAEHYKEHGNIPELSSLSSIDEYYNTIFDRNVRTRSALTLFLCCRSFYMDAEIRLFLGEELAVIVNEFINDYPYLFERRLNRVSLLHDSFNTYLRKGQIDYAKKVETVNEVVFKSIFDLEHRFLSRLDFFSLDKRMKKKIVTRYSSISVFGGLIHGVVDFEAIQSFYGQLREWIAELSPNDLTIENYYELSLIINIVGRDHVSGDNQFLYTYTRALLANGYTASDITSSGYVFAMLYYVQTGNSDLLLNLTSSDFHDTSMFVENLLREINEENVYFSKHKLPLSKERIEELLTRSTEEGFRQNVTFVLENLFLHEKKHFAFSDLTKCIKGYIRGEGEEAIYFLEKFLEEHDVRTFFARWILNDAQKNILALGHVQHANDYLNLSFVDFIAKHRQLSSFKLWIEILNYLRLSIHNGRTIDLSCISVFWTKYYARKDYSLISIPIALTVFEDKGIVGKRESIRLITSIQKVSEKGYSRLLAEYIKLHSIGIIKFLVETFDIDELHISWFNLPTKYVNQFPDILFNISMEQLLKYNSHNRHIDFGEIENVVRSNKCDDLRFILNLTKFDIRIQRGDKQIHTLSKKNIPFTEYVVDDLSRYRHNSGQRLSNGILTSREKKLIIEKKFRPEDVAGFSDGNYSTLADISLFSVFSQNEVKKSIRRILYNGLIGKVNSINSFHNLYYFPGNVLKLMSYYKIQADFNNLFECFAKFISLSMFDIYPEVPRSKNNQGLKSSHDTD